MLISSAQTAKNEAIKRSLAYSLYDGIAFSVMFGMSDSFFQAYGIFLGADNFALSLIKTLPITIGSLSQLLTGFFLRRIKSRRRFTSLFSFLHATMFIFLILAALLGPARVPATIVILCLINFFFLTPVPAWSSWMGDLVPEENRGHYFGRRTSITGIISFGSLICAGLVMQFAQKAHLEYLGFILLFAISFLGRFISAYFLSLKYDPPFNYKPKRYFDFRLLHQETKKSNILALISFLSLLNFALMVIAPFIDIYLLRHLKINYVFFTLTNATILGVKYLFMPFWGKACDTYGACKVLLVGAFLVSFVPLGWIFATSLPIILVLQVYGGFAWAAYEIASFNFVIDLTTSRSRASWVSLQNTASGLLGLLGSFAGSLLFLAGDFLFGNPQTNDNSDSALNLPFFLSPFFFIFLASCLLRLIILAIFFKKLKEQRNVKHISLKELPFRVIGMLANQGFMLSSSLFEKFKEKKPFGFSNQLKKTTSKNQVKKIKHKKIKSS